jgi:hypothetical protein
MKNYPDILFRLLLCLPILIQPWAPSVGSTQTPAPVLAAGKTIYLPLIAGSTAPSGVSPNDWPQAGHDPQRTNASAIEVPPPYCYSWKWYGAPIASRAQPVVSNGVLFIGGLDGVLYARQAATGAPLWDFSSGGPIRNSAGVLNDRVIFSSFDGFTYALNVNNGALLWKTSTGSSATAPLIDAKKSKVYVASTNGSLTALNSFDGSILWTVPSAAAILTSPSLSEDGSLVFAGNEAVQAFAVNAGSGALVWKTSLQGQSLADRYPVVAGNSVTFRSQPLYFFHIMLQQYGDQIMDQAGAVKPDWTADWAIVNPKITSFLSTQPQFQTYFMLNAQNGSSLGIPPVLYTFGNGDTPTPPVYAQGQLFLPYRARHGIQTDGGAVHVLTKYDAELGSLNLSSLNITGLKNTTAYSGQPQFRMTSDEGAILTMSGNLLLVDNWERLGGINVSTGQLFGIGNVANNWPECYTQCGPGGANPFFPMSGSAADPAYPFPAPRSAEGHSRGGAVVANNMIYWRVIEAGLACIAHSSGGACPAPKQWHDSAGTVSTVSPNPQPQGPLVPKALADYVTTDLTRPAVNPPQDLVNRLQNEVRALLQLANGQHLMPYYLEKGMANQQVWPYTYWNSAGKTGMAEINFLAHGNVYWFDPGELLYSLAMAFPYLDSALQIQVKAYVAGEMGRYPPLQDLPYQVANQNWLGSGIAREPYPIPFRAQINNWPPVAANIVAIYGLWLWSKNTNDYSYAQSHWAQIQSLFNARKSSLRYYADLSGIIGVYRLATDLASRDAGNSAAYVAAANLALQTAVGFMTSATNFSTFLNRANTDFPDPRGDTTGWSAPVFYGLTPEVGAYLAGELAGQPQTYLQSLETLNNSGVGLLWWYITRVGAHAEVGETSFLAPGTAWSHFLAHAYIVEDSPATLAGWLDRPWVVGDLYSIQKIVATIQAKP